MITVDFLKTAVMVSFFVTLAKTVSVTGPMDTPLTSTSRV